MREQLNSNPLAQVALVGVLLIAVGFFVLSSGGGGKEEEAGSSEPTVSLAEPGAAGEAGVAPVSVPAGTAIDAPPLPRPISRAYAANQTVVLLFVREGGIDDRLVKIATAGVAAFPDVSLSIVPASRISRYISITDGVGVDRVPALIVVTPKKLKQSVPTASVSYGFQSPQSIVQAVIDAGYEGPTVDYHP